jgi:hypothetical protein
MKGGDSARHPTMDAVAQGLSRCGLSAPVLFFLELHRPFTYPASQFAIFFQPLLGFVVGDENVSRFARWLSDEDGLSQLIGRLEDRRED